jgi:hypothetical protein
MCLGSQKVLSSILRVCNGYLFAFLGPFCDVLPDLKSNLFNFRVARIFASFPDLLQPGFVLLVFAWDRSYG